MIFDYLCCGRSSSPGAEVVWCEGRLRYQQTRRSAAEVRHNSPCCLSRDPGRTGAGRSVNTVPAPPGPLSGAVSGGSQANVMWTNQIHNSTFVNLKQLLVVTIKNIIWISYYLMLIYFIFTHSELNFQISNLIVTILKYCSCNLAVSSTQQDIPSLTILITIPNYCRSNILSRILVVYHLSRTLNYVRPF